MVKAGLLTKKEAEHHEKRNMITKAVGADYRIEPDFYVLDVKQGDRILICTDGLHGEVGLKDMTAIMVKDKPMVDICEELVEAAKNNGGSDNITMVVAEVTEVETNE